MPYSNVAVKLRSFFLFPLSALAAAALGQTWSETVLVDAENKVVLSVQTSRDKNSIQRSLKWVDPKVSKTILNFYKPDGEFGGGTLTILRDDRTQRVQFEVVPIGIRVVSTTATGSGRTTEIPRFDQESLVDPSVNWFVTTTPEKGATAKFASYNPERRFWEQVTVTYEGDGKLGDSPTGHIVTRKDAHGTSKMLLDDKGQPLVWIDGRLRLVKR